MTTDKTREAFEEWQNSVRMNPIVESNRRPDGSYSYGIQDYWESWQAARADLIAKLQSQQ